VVVLRVRDCLRPATQPAQGGASARHRDE
jgi:hypothetical protein